MCPFFSARFFVAYVAFGRMERRVAQIVCLLHETRDFVHKSKNICTKRGHFAQNRTKCAQIFVKFARKKAKFARKKVKFARKKADFARNKGRFAQMDEGFAQIKTVGTNRVRQKTKAALLSSTYCNIFPFSLH